MVGTKVAESEVIFPILMKEMYIGKAFLVQNVSLGTVSTEFAYWRKFCPWLPFYKYIYGLYI
jgi:hypothetical protein